MRLSKNAVRLSKFACWTAGQDVALPAADLVALPAIERELDIGSLNEEGLRKELGKVCTPSLGQQTRPLAPVCPILGT